MVNKNLFKTQKSLPKVPAFDTVNKAGGLAYKLDDEKALCQFVVTNTFGGTYYAGAGEQLEELKKIVNGCSSELIAKAAVYGREVGNMKDMPAYLLAVLAARNETVLFRQVFNRVVNNAKMLCTFVQIMRSGVTGRKSFGTSVKKNIQNWIINRSNTQLFYDDVGKGSPSLSDVIKMVHPKPVNDFTNNMFKYVMDKDYNVEQLPDVVKKFEAFKKDSSGEVPNVPFQCLSSIKLSDKQWEGLALNMPWNTLRMNLNQIARHNVFHNNKVTNEIANKLSNKELVLKSNVFPYQLLTTWKATDGTMPIEVRNALQAAMEHATENIPDFGVKVAIGTDVSASMGSPVTGNRGSVTTHTSCVEVAALFASAVARRNKNCRIIPFDTRVHNVTINPYDSIMTNTKKLSINGGGTACSVPMAQINSEHTQGYDLVIIISDNESWYDFSGSNIYRGGLAAEWAKYKAKNRKAKLVLLDITPNRNVQVKPQPDVLCVGGFNDEVFTVIDRFVKNGDSNEFLNTVKSVSLD